MKSIKHSIASPFKTLTRFELILWSLSLLAVTVSFLIGGKHNLLTLSASLIGVTALIFVAKGDVLGQILTVLFSLMYALISFEMKYYGEMITYLGMSAPIAIVTVVSWLRHPYEKGKREVKVASLNRLQITLLFVLSIAVTSIFYFILRYFGNASLAVSTVSVTTSFLAAGLMLLRSPYYALAYAANDIVLIILWIIAAADNISYLPMVINFIMFLLNDLYGFISWQKMNVRQNSSAADKNTDHGNKFYKI